MSVCRIKFDGSSASVTFVQFSKDPSVLQSFFVYGLSTKLFRVFLSVMQLLSSFTSAPNFHRVLPICERKYSR